MMEMTSDEGIKALFVEKDGFPYSDDTVMHIATARGLLASKTDSTLDEICTNVAK
jgi:ADP-ribosylglycohydrolase